MSFKNVRNFLVLFLCLQMFLPFVAVGETANWENTLKTAKGQHVFWNAWGGDTRFNAFMKWAGDEVNRRYGVTVHHVKINDTGDAVRSVLADKQAGRDSGGTIDLIWINGANFKTMKENDLLYGPFTSDLPNFALTSPDTNPAITTDFTVATEGYESPWGMVQLVILYDNKRTPKPARSSSEILAYAKANKGRLTYSAPPDFTGTSFLKQMLVELLSDLSPLAKPPENDKQGMEVTSPLWAYLDALHPHLWRDGEDFPSDAVGMERLLADGFIDASYSFNVNAAWLGISQGDLPTTTQVTTFRDGGLSNVNFVAIPYNSNAPEGAMVLANFLLSPMAQGRRQNPNYWGDPSVLDATKLSKQQSQFFVYDDLPKSDAIMSLNALQHTVNEPHPDWSTFIQTTWQRRYHTK